jgi:epoxyqueuosine reductase QueG
VEHPVLSRIRREGFVPLGWFAPQAGNTTLAGTAFVILIGNAGPEMFRRFARERDPSRDTLDGWTKATVDVLAEELSARALYPFDTPPSPFLTWARAAGAGHTSPLGLNIHPTYGLWHAYRAALLFPVAFDMPRPSPGAYPCETCADKPCVSACPVAAFDGKAYDYKGCGRHVLSSAGEPCMTGGCLARLACPVGRGYAYHPAQMQFHMRAFAEARKRDT